MSAKNYYIWGAGERGVSTALDLEKIKVNGIETLSYKDTTYPQFNREGRMAGGYLIIVDGPYGQPRYSRPQILDFVSELGKDFCIFMHDSKRAGEQETLSLLYERLSQNGVEFLKADYGFIKWHTIVCSKSWKFLASI